mmetsp:Transcript_47531/g.109353  ORF Transcript_47531/g.109353 Transcript_47531/m.109353 type:complete len:128 (+) Transcript_47531:728-1111(+)
MRCIEMALSLSHSPWIIDNASRKVGWGESGSGKLYYDLMASCDVSLFTQQIKVVANPQEAGPSGLAIGHGASTINANSMLTSDSAAAVQARVLASEHFRLPTVAHSATGEADDPDVTVHNDLNRSRT